MEKKQAGQKRYPSELKERAVRMVRDDEKSNFPQLFVVPPRQRVREDSP
jgi:hypothetical protein